MEPHLTNKELHAAAISLYLDHRSGSPQDIDPSAADHLRSCGACNERLLGDVAMLSAFCAHARREEPAAEAAEIRRTIKASTTTPFSPMSLSVAATIMLLVSVVFLPRQITPQTPAQSRDLSTAAPLASQSGSPEIRPASPRTENARAVLTPTLRVSQISSARFALRRSDVDIESLASPEIALSVFVSAVLPHLDPVDQWKVHQTALAYYDLYPGDQIDGRYGPRTKQALQAFLRPLGPAEAEAPPIEDGVLDRGAAGTLLSDFKVVVLQ